MIFVLSSFAQAADWNFYGSVRVNTWYEDKDQADTTQLDMGLQSNARLGARVKVNDSVGGRFEYGASGGNVDVRLLYGTWNFGTGTLLVGQDYEPVWLSISGQSYGADTGLGGAGVNYGGRTPQIRLTFGGLDLAVLTPDNQYFDATTGGANKLVDGDETKRPMLQFKYTHVQDNWKARFSGAWSRVSPKNMSDTDAYMLATAWDLKLGPAVLKGEIWAGENVGNISVQKGSTNDRGKGYAVVTDTGVEDVKALGWALVAKYQINEVLTIEGGYGQTELEENQVDNAVSSYYFQTPLTLAPGVFIVPEIGVRDYDEDDEKITYYGAKWQINF